MEILLNKLKYRSWHRGTREADLILGQFFDANYQKMSKKELIEYKKFLDNVSDNEIVLIIQGKKKWPETYPKSIVRLFKKHKKRANTQQ